MHAYMHLYTGIQTHVCKHVSKYAASACMCVCMFVFNVRVYYECTVHVRGLVRMHMCIFVYTHIYTSTQIDMAQLVSIYVAQPGKKFFLRMNECMYACMYVMSVYV